MSGYIKLNKIAQLIIGSPILSSMLFNCSNVIFRPYVYNDATPRQTGPDILKAMVVLILVSKSKTKVEMTLGTNSSKNPIGIALEDPKYIPIKQKITPYFENS
jgi:hypothetical protein